MKNIFNKFQKFISKPFVKSYKKDWLVKPEHAVELAFVSNGVEYHCFSSGYSMYYERYMACQDRLAEIEQRCTKEYLDLFQKTLKQYLNKGDLTNVAILNKNLEDLRSYVFNVELLYNLASVWYFSKDESPYTYDYEFAEKKILEWKKDKEVLTFFLQSPIREFLPQLNISPKDLIEYIKGLNIIQLQRLKYHLSQQHKNDNDNGIISMLESQILALETLQLTLSSE